MNFENNKAIYEQLADRLCDEIIAGILPIKETPITKALSIGITITAGSIYEPNTVIPII